MLTDLSLSRHLSHRAYSPSRPSLSHLSHKLRASRTDGVLGNEPHARESTAEHPQGRHLPRLPRFGEVKRMFVRTPRRKARRCHRFRGRIRC